MPRKCNNEFLFYWATCHGQQYTIFKGVQRNAAMGFFFVLQSSYVHCCQQYRMVCRSLCFNKFGFCGQILMEVSHIKLHENPSSGGWVVTCRWWLEVTKLLADCCNYLNVTTKINFFIASVPHTSECTMHIGLALFLNLTQNKWLIHCSKFQLPIFQQETQTHTPPISATALKRLMQQC